MKSFDAPNSAVRTIRHLIIVAAMLGFTAANARLNAQSASTNFVSFQDFVANTSTAAASDFMAGPDSHVKDAAAFEQMRQYLLTIYRGMDVSHSFVADADSIDCIPIEQQPSVRLSGTTEISPIPPELSSAASASSGAADNGSASAGESDPFGNTIGCEEATVPMLRVTLDQLVRFETLEDFFQKGPGGAGQAPAQDGLAAPAATRRYAHAFQQVNNLGGTSILNLWDPQINLANGQVFSLSQVWYTAGNGNTLQTIEAGWQNYPQYYGDQKSRLFIFWTANNYGQGGTISNIGCYNLTCPMVGFVQLNHSWVLGGAFPKYSEMGGTQQEFTLQWYLRDGNWWLSLGDKNRPFQVIGYYSTRLFRGGLLSTNAHEIDFGGEVLGAGNWPPMGSGGMPALGFGQAAYQRRITYIDLARTQQQPTLTRVAKSPCYGLTGPSFSPLQWYGTYFYFGGPGGGGC